MNIHFCVCGPLPGSCLCAPSCTQVNIYLLQVVQQLEGPQVTLNLHRFFDWKVGC